jgi:16S rRNA (uracil1498-N3)-methyltransferase
MLDPAAQQTLSLWLQDREKPVSSPERLAIYVGPEGGWTVAEGECLQEHGVVAARLGRRILRTETAGIVAAAVVRSARGDW